MGKIFCLMGKSASGKDTMYKKLLNRLPLRTVVPYTTRPVRDGEQNGVEYYFVGQEEFDHLLEEGKVIEFRVYDTVFGPWTYFTADDGQIQLDVGNYLVIGTLESYLCLQNYFGKEHVAALYLQVDDGVRLERALCREREQQEPKYAEMCRRFLADEEDFTEEKLRNAGIEKRFLNEEEAGCIEELVGYIKGNCQYHNAKFCS